jgi:putative serine protease PepD
VVGGVTTGGPADRAGLRTGDVVVALDARPVASMSALVVALRDHRPGDSVPLTVVRDGQVRIVPVTLDDQP